MAIYIGITLGPIGDTMSFTSTPAGLWAASYLFSYLAHSIRKNIGKVGLVRDNLEYETGKTVSYLFNKGVGLYHDRIIFEADEEYTFEKAVEAVDASVNEIIDGFEGVVEFSEERPYLEKFFREYFNIHIVSVDMQPGENFLVKTNDVLDATELEKNFPTQIRYNPILRLFDGDDGKKNENIKDSFLVSGKDKNRKLNWVLTDNSEGGIKDLPSIAASKEGTYEADAKASKYYAVIRADGDNMGKTVKEIADEKSYVDFSDKCSDMGVKPQR